jgi:hypothetical protein
MAMYDVFALAGRRVMIPIGRPVQERWGIITAVTDPYREEHAATAVNCSVYQVRLDDGQELKVFGTSFFGMQ